MAGWDRFTKAGVQRDYLVDPLPKLISKSFADFLFSEDPRFMQESNQDDLDHVVTENRLPAGLHRAERIASSEGEVWFKLHVNREIADVALIEWLGRLSVVPFFYADRLLAAAFVREVARTVEAKEDAEDSEVVWRHAEIHTAKRVVNVLYRGEDETLGSRVELNRRPETTDINPEWTHGLPMLAGRIVNELDEDVHLGESDYDQVRDELLALNEAMTIAAENARLTGQDRIFVAGRLLQQDGDFDASMTVFRTEGEGTTLGEGGDRPPVVAVEKKYDAIPLWTHIEKLTHVVVNRVGLVAQWVGESVPGRAESGTAIRLRFMPTINTAEGKKRPWTGALPHLVHLILTIGALSVQEGGFGRTYTQQDPPTVEFTDPLPTDETEVITTNATAVAAEIRSRETAIREQHPEWDDGQVNDELRKIREDTSLSAPLPPPQPSDEAQIRAAHPDWTDQQVADEVQRQQLAA